MVQYTLNEKSVFIDSYQFLCSSLECLVKKKNLADENDFKRLSQKFYSQVL